MPERQLLNSLEEAGLILDKSGQIHHCNPRLREVLQYDPTGKEIRKVFPEIREDWIRSALESPEAAAFVFQSASLNRKCLATILPSEDHFLFLLWPAEKQQEPFPDDVSLLGLLPFGVVLIDDAARVYRSNAAARRLLGVQDSLWNLNDAWKGARDSANRRRSIE
ncbi:MAG: PAS domain-containing protein, partial [Leptospiraceae bacterium]|nr:PAS domain-containing protein [Leptospiraceae bacterium]